MPNPSMSMISFGAIDLEALFARDEDDVLIVREKATRERFKKQVTLTIDGFETTVFEATPMTDFLGNVEKDKDGFPKPRATTIYDAAKQLVDKGVWSRAELDRRIPVLCHRDHLNPVAVCRICSVHVSKKRRRDGRIMPSPKLIPACQHEVQPEMVVTTQAGWEGYNPQEKKNLAKERKALWELKAPSDSNAEGLKLWLEQTRKLLRLEPKDEQKELLGKIAARLMTLKLMETDEDSSLAAEQAALKELEASKPDDKDEQALNLWLERARQGLGLTPKSICEDLLKRAAARRRSMDDLAAAVREYGQQTLEAVSLLSELLLADHGHVDPGANSKPIRYENELINVASRLGITSARPALHKPARVDRNHPPPAKSRAISLPLLEEQARANARRQGASRELTQKLVDTAVAFPYSSRSIQVDHDRCILCDRCVRSCTDVKPFKVIGHAGKGYRTRISFDLDRLMNESSCVQCGECMTACPTGALTLNRRVVPKPVWEALNITRSNDSRLAELADPDQPLPAELGFLSADELSALELHYTDENNAERSFFPFAGIPFAFLRWNEGAVRRRRLKKGQVLCSEGDFGSTAFLLEHGDVEVWAGANAASPRPGLLGSLVGWRASSPKGRLIATLTARKHLIAGEMACLTNTARTATLLAAGDATVLEVTRNVLQMLQRAAGAREVLDRIYRRRAIDSCLRNGALFRDLTPADHQLIVGELLESAELRRVEPGEVIVAQGDREGDFYVIRLGFVKVAEEVDGQQSVLAQLGSDKSFGEFALLGYHPDVEQAARNVGFDPNIRTATCSALSDVEVVRVPRDAFRQLLMAFPSIEGPLVERCVAMLKHRMKPAPLEQNRLGEFQRQGLFQSQKMLVLDLLSCTRCDECTRACADAHGDGHSRLLREGLRFGDFLVAASCRSCHQPYCMDGCPVDAIHRKGTALEVLIEDHCIGCSLCERNCPYGSIQMVPKQRGEFWSDLLDDMAENPHLTAAIPRRSVNCDLCNGLVKPGQDPFCVSACPHEAAFRWSGEKLDDEMKKRSSRQANQI